MWSDVETRLARRNTGITGNTGFTLCVSEVTHCADLEEIAKNRRSSRPKRFAAAFSRWAKIARRLRNLRTLDRAKVESFAERAAFRNSIVLNRGIQVRFFFF